jgi:hypothetical protein
LRFEGRAICLRGTATEILNKEAHHSMTLFLQNRKIAYAAERPLSFKESLIRPFAS